MSISSTNRYVETGGLRVACELYEFVGSEITPGSGVTAAEFWQKFAAIIAKLHKKNRALLAHRDALQQKIDAYHRANSGPPPPNEYQKFLTAIGYLDAAAAAPLAQTENVDAEIARIAAPQLVVPVDNARYALNAANARWGNLYDALYASDVIPESGCAARGGEYNPARGARVIKYANDFLDATAPLTNASHAQVVKYELRDGKLIARLADSATAELRAREIFAGYRGDYANPAAVILRHNNLHIELGLQNKKSQPLSNIKMEAAATVIMDCEDSVAAVDAADKVRVYRNWHGLMRGDLTAAVTKNGKQINRALADDIKYTDADGGAKNLRGTALMFIRHVGAHMYTDAVQYQGGDIPETFLDAMVTAVSAKHNLSGAAKFKNSNCGSVYIVKPKMHGADEVAAAVELFAEVERAIDLPPATLKIGIMDEERRTTLNLPACIGAAAERIVFINTGFLDRTGDEIHTCMQAGAVVPKQQMKTAAWLRAYEDWNVAVGLAAGLAGRAQIGKGMWAAPDNMAAMLCEKIAHPQAGATTAWVPSPVAATLHALHYHQVDARARQRELTAAAERDALLQLPLLAKPNALTQKEIARELESNAQSVLGYVVRWVDAGVGCSKVPDLDNTMLMEDRATLRISSQHIANWLQHGLASKDQVVKTFKAMAMVVDRQNADDASYKNLAPKCDGAAYQAALALALTGITAANGYTEPVLHHRRRMVKNTAAN